MSRWAAERRLDYVDFRLLTAGGILRDDLMRTFGVSLSVASLDLNKFLALYPGSMTYDKSRRTYVPVEAPYLSRRGHVPECVAAIEALAALGHPLGWV